MTPWTSEEDAIIREQAALGLSTTQIANEIYKQTKINRNRFMVLGRSRRIGVTLLRTDNRPKTTWDSPARTEELARLWKDGHSTRVIGVRLSALFGEKITKNSVISQAHRCGVASEFPRPKGMNQPKGAPKPPRPPRVSRPVKLVPQAVPIDTSNARPWLTRLRSECKFPLGEAGDIHSCCAPVFGNTGYCEPHAAVCFLPRPVKRAA